MSARRTRTIVDYTVPDGWKHAWKPVALGKPHRKPATHAARIPAAGIRRVDVQNIWKSVEI